MRASASMVILAGGRSRRMGQSKATLKLDGKTLLERLLDQVGCRFEDITVVAAPREEETFAIEKLLEGCSEAITLHRDEAAFRGPAAALIEGLRSARLARVFVCSCDLPFLSFTLANELLERLDGFDAAIPIVDGRWQPLCAAYQRSCAGVLAEGARLETRLTKLILNLRLRSIDEASLRLVDPDLRSFFNLNTSEDYQRAQRMLGPTMLDPPARHT